MEIRLYEKSDSDKVLQLLKDTIEFVNPQGFTESHKRSWAPDNIHLREWEESCLRNFTVLATVDADVVGIAQLEDFGHINCFYCHAKYRRQGIGTQLYAVIEERARLKSISKLFTESETSFQPFFEKLGFQHVQKQQVVVGGKIQTSHVMEKAVMVSNS